MDEHFQKNKSIQKKHIPLGAIDVFPALILIVAAFLVHWGTLKAGFISDDFVLLSMTDRADSVFSFFHTNWLLEQHSGGFYRPMVMVLWKIDRMMWGFNPLGYHFTNILLHAITVMLIFFLTFALVGRRSTAFFCSLFFCVHPVHSEAIAWLSGRTDLCCAVFFFSALLFYVVYLKYSRRVLWYLLSLLMFIFSLLSKEMAFTLPVAAIILDFLIKSKPLKGNKSPRSAFVFRTVPFFIILGVVVYIRYRILGGIGGYGESKHFRFDLIIFNYFKHYFNWMLTPFRFITLERSHHDIVAWGTLAVLALGLLKRQLRTGILIFVVTLLPVLNLCRPQYLYIPSWGLLLVLSVLIFSGRRGWTNTFFRLLLIVILVLFWTVEVRYRNREWVRTGGVGLGVRDIMTNMHPFFPDDSELYFRNLPINTAIPIGVFQNGLQEAVRMWYGNGTLTAKHVSDFRSYAGELENEGKRYFFHMDRGFFYDMTDAVRSKGNETVIIKEGESITLDYLHKKESIRFNEPVRAYEMELWSLLADGADMENGSKAGEIELKNNDDTLKTLSLRAGIETAEWAYHREDLKDRIEHNFADAVSARLLNVFSRPVQIEYIYRSRFELDPEQTITGLIFRYAGPPSQPQRKTLIQIRKLLFRSKQKEAPL